MNYSIFIVNQDGSASLVGQTSDLASAEASANGQPSGTTCRIEFGNDAQSSVVEFIEVP
jgi:hypothetical protein